MARTTLRECEAYVARARAAGVRAGVPHSATWELDYAACYGGAAVGVNGSRGTLGDAMMSANRMAPAAFCQAMRILIDVLEDMPAAADKWYGIELTEAERNTILEARGYPVARGKEHAA